MDTKRLYVDFHVLQTVPPSCVNRDDTGSPKTAVYGGATRARVSSQAWKHAIRKMFAEEMADMVETGKRTLKATDLVAGELAALAPELDDARLKKDAKKALENAGIKLKDDNNAALLFLSTAQARALARLAAEDCEEKDDYKKALKENPSVDMALFGRMVASDPSLNYDAAAQVGPQHPPPMPCRTSLITSPPWMTVPRRIRQVRAIWARWSTTLHPVSLCHRQHGGTGAPAWG